MATQIGAIQPREVLFRTQTNADWLDGLLIWQAGSGGVVAGAQNAARADLTVDSVDPGTTLGAHLVTITATGGVPRFSVTAPDDAGTVTARGVIGVPAYAGGIRSTLGPALAGAYTVGDTFAISVLPVPIDLTGLRFVLQMRATTTSATVAFQADSAPPDGTTPTIATGGAGGVIGLAVPRQALARNLLPPGTYVYDLLAIDPTPVARAVPAFFGTVVHVDGVTFIS